MPDTAVAVAKTTHDDSNPLTLSPPLFRAVMQLCKSSLAFSQNHKTVRNSVASMIFELRRYSKETVGYETPDVIELRNFLRRTDPRYEDGTVDRPKPRRDPIHLLQIRRRLKEDQVDAAKEIRFIWASFSRGLQSRARNYEAGSANGVGRILQPIDFMNADQLNMYSLHYKPWFEAVRYVTLTNTKNEVVVAMNPILMVLLDHISTDDADAHFKLKRGSTLKVLREALDKFVAQVQRNPLPESDS